MTEPLTRRHVPGDRGRGGRGAQPIRDPARYPPVDPKLRAEFIRAGLIRPPRSDDEVTPLHAIAALKLDETARRAARKDLARETKPGDRFQCSQPPLLWQLGKEDRDVWRMHPAEVYRRRKVQVSV